MDDLMQIVLLQQEQHTGMLFMQTQQVQPALHIAIMHSQQA
jgi:hypothetical protein